MLWLASIISLVDGRDEGLCLRWHLGHSLAHLIAACLARVILNGGGAM